MKITSAIADGYANCVHCKRQFETDVFGGRRLYCSRRCSEAASKARQRAARLAQKVKP